MTTDEIKDELKKENYDFLRSNEHLGDNIVLLGLGGSYAYGTNTENSDIDIRGAALNSVRDILLKKDFEQVTDIATDTTVYSFDKLITLLVNCNPNVIEILGLKDEHYLYVSDAGRQLLENKEMFLSQRAVHSFGGYANQQLRRLENGSARSQDRYLREKHLLKVVQGIGDNFRKKFAEYPEGALKMYIDRSEPSEYEIYVDFDLKHYPLKDFNRILSETNAVEREYNKLGMRNSKAIAHGKLEKHAMHLVRLYYMAFDILEQKKIVTYREDEHELLMSIRRGAFTNENNLFSEEFYELENELEKRLEYAEKNTDLPKEPDQKMIDDFVVSVNGSAVKNAYNI